MAAAAGTPPIYEVAKFITGASNATGNATINPQKG
jgi:hypothetical protein